MINLREPGTYIERFLKIRTKDGRVIPLRMNPAQEKLYRAVKRRQDAGKPVRVIILKARQMGFSTMVEALLFHQAATHFHTECMIVANSEEATANLFRMSRRFYDELPEQIKPVMRASNAQELVFDKPARDNGPGLGLDSRIRCATAGGRGVGRSYTLRGLHLSEFAFWPGDKRETFTGLVQAVPDQPGTMIFVESTANGYDEFKNMWDAAVQAQRDGEDGFIPLFFPWFEMEEYRRAVPPGFTRTAEEAELAESFGLDDEQLCWRRWCIANQCGGDLNLFHQEYPSTPDEAFIATGQCVFDQAKLVLRRDRVRQLDWERGKFRVERGLDGKIVRYVWTQDGKGPIRILKHPEPGAPYVIGGDTAGTGSDWFVGQVLDNRTGEQVAVLHHQYGERAYAEQMYCLGMYYNEALIGVETNYSTYPEMCLEDLGYKRLYVRQRYDDYTGKLVPAFGFDTNSSTRPVIVDGLKDVADRCPHLLNDYETLGEMLTFVYDKNWRPQAENGAHDDLVMALAIAHGIRGQQETAARARAVQGTAVWEPDMWADYERAGPELKEMLLQKWGIPR